MPNSEGSARLEVLDVEHGPADGDAKLLTLHTNAEEIRCRFHDAPAGDRAVLWVFGAGGGLGGPAGGVYPRLARQLAGDGVASLELAYRRPADLENCVLDVQAGLAHLGTLGRSRIVLVGHSFGGAVVISVGAVNPDVIAVAALSSISRGTEAVERISPRPLLLMHGEADEVVSVERSREIYGRAREPKRLVLFPDCLHGLDQCREELDRDLLDWLRGVLGLAT